MLWPCFTSSFETIDTFGEFINSKSGKIISTLSSPEQEQSDPLLQYYSKSSLEISVNKNNITSKFIPESPNSSDTESIVFDSNKKAASNKQIIFGDTIKHLIKAKLIRNIVLILKL